MPLGKVLVCDGKDPLKVTGVMKNIPANSHFVMDFVVPFEFNRTRTRLIKWGAKQKQLIRQFLGESLVLTFIALILAIIMVQILLPAFNSFIERDLGLNLQKNSMVLLGIFVLVGLLAGSYPALAISSFKPVTVVKGKYSSGPKGSALRNFLVVTQFTISIILLVCTFVIMNQLSFIKNRDVGYTKDQVVLLKIRDEETRNKIAVIKTGLLQHPDILSASFSNALPNEMNMKQSISWPGKPENVKALMFALFGDYDFIGLYGIKILKRRNFSRDFSSDKQGVYLLNESAVKSLGWENPIGKDFSGESNLELRGKIVGIIKDFHLLSFHKKIEPVYLYLKPGMYSWYISVKIRGNNIPGTIKFLEENMKTFSPTYPFEYSFFDDIFANVYRTEQKLGDAFGIFALTAILIACLGLFGLSSLSTESRTREIGICKVLGAAVTNVTLMLSKKFIRWVLLANIIAWPAAYYFMSNWLQNFAYRTSIGIEVFILPGLLTLVIAFLTVSYQSIKTATANPVKALRYE